MVPLAKYKKLEALAEERGKKIAKYKETNETWRRRAIARAEQIKVLEAQIAANGELAKWQQVKVLLRQLLGVK